MNADKPGTRSPNRRKFRIFLFVAFLSIGSWFCYLESTQRPRAFVRQWSERFREIDNLDAAKKFSQNNAVFLREFPSGEWLIATCEHSCCSGAGFDATVIRDSSDTIFADTSHTFCGVEAMYAELGRIDAETLSAFYQGLKALDLNKQ